MKAIFEIQDAVARAHHLAQLAQAAVSLRGAFGLPEECSERAAAAGLVAVLDSLEAELWAHAARLSALEMGLKPEQLQGA